MGYNMSWVAVRGKVMEAVYAEIGAGRTGIHVKDIQKPLVGATLPGGWTLVVAEHTDRLVQDALLTSLSSGGEAVACFIEDHVMFSMAVGWKDGRKVWSLAHNAETGIEHLDVQGDLPPAFAEIRERRFVQQKQTAQNKGVPRSRLARIVATVLSERKQPASLDVDHIFEVPIDLAEALAGFRPEKEFPSDQDKPFESLTDA